MLKVNEPSGFPAGMGSSVRRTWALIWVLPPLQTKHSFVLRLLLTKPHCQPVLLGSLCRACEATPHSSPGPGERLSRRGAERGRWMPHARLPSLQSPQVAPTRHHLGLGLLLSDPSHRGPATVPSESENYKAIICAAIGILFFRSEGINETQGQWERIPKAQRQQVSGGAAREGPQCQERASLTGRCLAVPQLRRAAGCAQGSPDTHPSLPNQPSPSRLQTVTSSGGTGTW